MRPIRLVAGFLTVGFWTLLSRILGFVRDILMAAYLGAGPVAEAFLIAFALPNMFRRFFGEGAFNVAFVPMFAKKLESGDDPGGFAAEAFAGMCVLLTAFSVAGILAMPLLVAAMASGFLGDQRFALAVDYGRIAFPYILLVSLTALLSGVLNATGRFVAAAAAPVLLNLVFILGVLAAAAVARPGHLAEDAFAFALGDWLAWSVPVGGLAQLALVWWAAARAGFAPRWVRPRLSPDLRRLAVIAAPAALAGGVVQVNLLVGRQVASFFEGAIAWLAYADRLYQLPLGVVGIAIGVVLLPDLARRLAAGDEAGGRDALSRAGEFALMLTLPAAVALVVIAVPIVAVLYERGAFGPDDTAATALALAIYGAGLPAFVLHKVLQPLYFAREDTRRPFRYAAVSMLVNAALAIGLAPLAGFAAAALGTTVAGWGMVWQLWRGARTMGRAAEFDARFRARAARIAAASAVMGLALWGGMVALAPWMKPGGAGAPALAALILGGMAVYFGTGQLIGAFRLSEFTRALRRRRAG
jgi:putative peptidoglycan lipid II flippase